jgi:hypothetical protein
MTKAAILISAALLFAGVAAASSMTSLGLGHTPTIGTPTPSTPTGAVPQANRQTGEISGPCDEPEHANDPRCAGATGGQRRDDDGSGNHRNSGPGNVDDSSGQRGGNSGPGGGDDDD